MYRIKRCLISWDSLIMIIIIIIKAYVKITTIRRFYRLSLEAGMLAIRMIKPCLIPTVPKRVNDNKHI